VKSICYIKSFAHRFLALITCGECFLQKMILDFFLGMVSVFT